MKLMTDCLRLELITRESRHSKSFVSVKILELLELLIAVIRQTTFRCYVDNHKRFSSAKIKFNIPESKIC